MTGCILVTAGIVLGAWLSGDPDATATAALLLIVFAAGLVSSIAGFAFSALAAAPAAMVLADPVEAVGTLLAASIAMQVYSVWQLRRSIEWRRVAPFLLGGLSSLPVGVALLTRVPAAAFAALLGAFLLAYGALRLARRGEFVARGGFLRDVLAGITGGITGGLAAFPGAFVTPWCGMRGWSKDVQRAVFQPYILVMQVAALALLSAGTHAMPSADRVLAVVPVALLAAHLGIAVFRRLSGPQFSVALHVLLMLSGAALMARVA